MSISRTESISSLRAETVDRLQQLVQVNLDSAAGFRNAADVLNDSSLAAEFRVWAADRTRQADELGRVVERNFQQPPQERTWTAALHQTWLKLRAAIHSGDAYVVLTEAERGEDQIIEKYEDVLQETVGSSVNDLLKQQVANVRAVHNRVRELRDARKRRK